MRSGSQFSMFMRAILECGGSKFSEVFSNKRSLDGTCLFPKISNLLQQTHWTRKVALRGPKAQDKRLLSRQLCQSTQVCRSDQHSQEPGVNPA